MLSKLKDLFGPGPTTGAKGHRRRVNLQRRFALVSEMAHGSMSRVHRAVDNETGKTVCLKVQQPEKNRAAIARASAEQLRPTEGEIAIQFVHPNVVRTFEYGDSTQGEHYMMMEFIDGMSFQYIRETRTARTAQRVELLAQAAEGLAAVHAAGFIHHDINPRNFLINRQLQVKLIDFGLSIPNTPAFRRPGNRTGNLQYMAPELLRREPIDERIDIFAFGVLAFELLTDRLPYDANDSTRLMLQRINAEPLDPAIVKPNLSDALCQILRKLTSRQKDQRWAEMSTLPEALRSVPAKRQRV